MIPFRLWENEKIRFKCRRTWAVLIPKFFGSLIYFGIPAAVISALIFSWLGYKNIWLPVMLFFLAFSFLVFFYAFWRWWHPVFFVTDRRVLFVEKNLFSGKKVELQLQNISEVVSVKKNFFNTLFNFGTILITPVSGTQKFRVFFIPDSDQVAEFISEQSSKTKIEGSEPPPPEKQKSEGQALSGEENIEKTFRSLAGIKDFFELDYEQKNRIAEIESSDNRGVFEILRKNRVFCILRDGTVAFPASCMVGLPSLKVHEFLAQNFNHVERSNSIVLVGV